MSIFSEISMGQLMHLVAKIARPLDKVSGNIRKTSPLIVFRNSLFVLQCVFINDQKNKGKKKKAQLGFELRTS